MKFQKGFIPIVLAIAICSIAVVMVGAGIYFKVASDKLAAEQVNTNQLPGDDLLDEFGCVSSAGYSWCVTTQKCIRAWEESCPGTNSNTETDLNVNATVNTNATNQNANVNTNTVPSDWQTYTNSDIGYSLKYPNGWTVTEINEPSEIVSGQTARFVSIVDSGTTRSLHLGIKPASDSKTDIWYRTGIGAGDFQAGDMVNIAGTQIQSYKLVYQNRAVEIFYENPSQATDNTIGNNKVSAYYSSITEDEIDITIGNDYQTANTILSTLTFTK